MQYLLRRNEAFAFAEVLQL